MTDRLFRYISPLEVYHNNSGPSGLMKKIFRVRELYLFLFTVLLQTKVVKTFKKKKLEPVQQFQLINCFINSLKIKDDTERASAVLRYLFSYFSQGPKGYV